MDLLFLIMYFFGKIYSKNILPKAGSENVWINPLAIIREVGGIRPYCKPSFAATIRGGSIPSWPVPWKEMERKYEIQITLLRFGRDVAYRG